MSLDITNLIAHPETLDRNTLFALREVLAKYPYFQAARLVYLQNLFLTHDASFGAELRRAAIMLPSRLPLFHMVEGSHYDFPVAPAPATTPAHVTTEERKAAIIDRFLDRQEHHGGMNEEEGETKKSMPVENATDYSSVLLGMDDLPSTSHASSSSASTLVPATGQEKNIATSLAEEEESELGGEYLTETLAKIYVKQGNYAKALEIIRKLKAKYPRKSRYFADQIRFLEKVVFVTQGAEA